MCLRTALACCAVHVQAGDVSGCLVGLQDQELSMRGELWPGTGWLPGCQHALQPMLAQTCPKSVIWCAVETHVQPVHATTASPPRGVCYPAAELADANL